MKNSNRKFLKDQWKTFENLSPRQVRELCFIEPAFTNLMGFLYLKKGTVSDRQHSISKKSLSVSMKTSLFLSRN